VEGGGEQFKVQKRGQQLTPKDLRFAREKSILEERRSTGKERGGGSSLRGRKTKKQC